MVLQDQAKVNLINSAGKISAQYRKVGTKYFLSVIIISVLLIAYETIAFVIWIGPIGWLPDMMTAIPVKFFFIRIIIFIPMILSIIVFVFSLWRLRGLGEGRKDMGSAWSFAGWVLFIFGFIAILFDATMLIWMIIIVAYGKPPLNMYTGANRDFVFVWFIIYIIFIGIDGLIIIGYGILMAWRFRWGTNWLKSEESATQPLMASKYLYNLSNLCKNGDDKTKAKGEMYKTVAYRILDDSYNDTNAGFLFNVGNGFNGSNNQNPFISPLNSFVTTGQVQVQLQSFASIEDFKTTSNVVEQEQDQDDDY